MFRIVSLGVFATMFVLASGPAGAFAEDSDSPPFTVIVMDPLSAPLACDCVEGYAQRKYEVFGEFLEKWLDREVQVVWSQSLVSALDGDANGHADLIIGKHSVVLSDAALAEMEVEPVAQLTGTDGLTTQSGLIVVRAADPAQSVADLEGYRILFGPADCDEKSAAPMALLTEHGIAVPEEPETCPACSDAATKLLELGEDVQAAAVISSYAQPLLEGCGTIKKGDLRVVGESETVPFITAFVNGQLDEAARQQIQDVLMEVQYDVNAMIALETKNGFVPCADIPADEDTVAAAKKKD